MDFKPLLFFERLHRGLADDEEDSPPGKWEPALTLIVIVAMFGVLVLDRVGTDSVMLTALAIFYLSGIISTEEALKGFSSQGLLAVMILFVVAEGLNKTGALNWYVGKLFGTPKTIAGAQMRVMFPIVALSGFINDTPLVMITLPIVIQWAKTHALNLRFILLPLSFAALLGGVCTIIGTSTNLIIVGLLTDTYPDNPEFEHMSLFAISQYGVPVALVGVAYVIFATPYLLVRNKNHRALMTLGNDAEDILLGARLTQWSPAAGRTIRRSGLRDTGGIYLVSVKRSATGNTHTAVSPEFVLEVDDILYFTGFMETFGDFCEEHGLEVITNEIEMTSTLKLGEPQDVPNLAETYEDLDVTPLKSPTATQHKQAQKKLETLGITLDTLLDATQQERMRFVFSMEDSIRGGDSDFQATLSSSTSRVVVAKHEEQDLVVLAIDAPDRPGLLLDISKCLARLKLEARHTEAAVRGIRSLSIWRCEVSSENNVTEEYVSEIYTVTQTLFAKGSGAEAMRQRGLQVMRARVQDGSRLDGKTLTDVSNFRDTYKAAVVAIQKGNGTVHTEYLSTVIIDVGDLLVLQVCDDSPLLETPPEGFYIKDAPQRVSFLGISSRASKIARQEDLDKNHDTDVEDANGLRAKEAIWNDLEVSTASAGVQREFLTAMVIAKGSGLAGKTLVQAGIHKLPGVFLVSIDRPISSKANPQIETFSTVPFTEMLTEGDVLWFSGTASNVGDLRKIPGLVLYESGEVMKVNERIQNRRLVEAVVSRHGTLVGKTVKEVQFRSVYGAVVIAVHREGRRVHELPGNIKLHVGDVLLLEAGKSFVAKNKKLHDNAFTLMTEVEGSSPPRFRMLFPALVLTIAAYACYMAKLSTLFGTALTAAVLMVMLGVLSEEEARESIRWEIYLTIAPAYGVGFALINSGVAGAMSSFLVRVGNGVGIGDAGILGSVYLATVIMSQMIANNAAAALIFPIAMGAAEESDIDTAVMSFAIMLAASAAFMTPFGYQTNLIVLGPGGYKTSDYLIFGTPMQVVLAVISTWALVEKKWWLVWLVSASILAAVCLFRVSTDMRNMAKKTS